MVLRTKTAYRRFASIEQVGFFAIARTMNVSKIRREQQQKRGDPVEHD